MTNLLWGGGASLLFVILGLAVGKMQEARHYHSLQDRQRRYAHITATNLRRLPAGVAPQEAQLCIGSVVIASDAFKNFAARLRNLVGGHIHSLETLLDRARREAILRMLEDADRLGARWVLNVRYETTVVGGQRKRGVNGVEMIAYGTAILESPGTVAGIRETPG